MFVRADLGADPWNVFHLGVANLLSMNIGLVIIAVGVLVLLAWIPLRQRPGFGTLSNVIMIGLAADAALVVIPGFESLLTRSGLLVAAVILNALATSLYIGAGFGWSVRTIRTAIEVSVLLSGWLLGGTVGVGTVLYALAIGPLIQICLPWFRHLPQSRICVRNEPTA